MKLMKKALLGAALVQLMLPILYFVLSALPQTDAFQNIAIALFGLCSLGAGVAPHIDLPQMSLWAETSIRVAGILTINFVVYLVLFYACLRLWDSRKNGDHFDAPIAMNPAQ